MICRNWGRFALVLLVGLALGFGAVPARADEGLDKARELVDEAEPFSKRAGNPARRSHAHDCAPEARSASGLDRALGWRAG